MFRQREREREREIEKSMWNESGMQWNVSAIVLEFVLLQYHQSNLDNG